MNGDDGRDHILCWGGEREQFRIWHATLDKVFAQEMGTHAVRKALPQIRSLID